MKPDEFEDMMRKGEYMHQTVVPAGLPIVIRVDGRGFSKYTMDRFEKPFDEKFSSMMWDTTEHLVREMGAIYGYVESDEISILLPPSTEFFGRSVEKLVSISAAASSSYFSILAKEPVQFDSRLWVWHEDNPIDHTVDYFRWRQADSSRNCVQAYVYWLLRKSGVTRGLATGMMKGKGHEWKLEKLKEFDVEYEYIPAWQRNGIGFQYKRKLVEGINEHTGESYDVMRNVLVRNDHLPVRWEYNRYIKDIIECLNSPAVGVL